MKRCKQLILLAGVLCCALQLAAQQLSLAGRWRFRLDSNDAGIREQWYRQKLEGTVTLPGAMQAQGYGSNPSVRTRWIGDQYEPFLTDPRYAPYRSDAHFKFPFWLTPVKYYVGPAWYQREVDIPAAWKGKRIVLSLERCHWGTTVFVDDQLAGADSSLATPHNYDLGAYLAPGRHTITIRVDNRYLVNVGVNAHSASDQTQGTWNGIAGSLSLQAGSPVFIKQVQVYPDVPGKTVKVRVQIGGSKEQAGKITLRAREAQGTAAALPPLEQAFTAADSIVELQYPMGAQPRLWDEFHPNLYRLTVQLQTSGQPGKDEQSLLFGMRSIGTQGSKITVNGRPVFLRGTLECAIFPLTGYPPTDTASWGRIYRIIKAHGLNHMRFHSWCPPEAAFTAADHEGVYLSVEVDAWARVGDNTPVDRFLYRESDRITEAYGNHPSFCMMVPTNEPAGGKNRDNYLAGWVRYWQQKDQRRLYSAGAGWPLIAANDYHVTPDPRIQGWGEELKSVINAKAPNTLFNFKDKMKKLPAPGKPVVAHEIGQWCVYPDFTEIKRYTGLLQARNFEIFRDFMQQNHLLPQARDFFMASGKLQVLCYKADIEAGLRTDYAGYQLLDLHDFPGQGTALVGILDPFWNSKPYCTPAEYRRFAGSTVPLAGMEKFTWKNSETFHARLQVAHFGEKQLKDTPVEWVITDKDKRKLASGRFRVNLDWKADNPAGDIAFNLAGVKAPAKLHLEVNVPGLGANGWDFWVYPEKVNTDVPGTITVTDKLDEKTEQHLRQGGTVLLMLNGKIAPGKGKEIKTGMSTVFWNTQWTKGQGPHTLGILCNPASPLFKQFPTAFHSDWQWWDMLHTAQAMDLSDFPPSLKPGIQLIDTWFEARRLGLLLEARIGKGRLVVTSIDFTKDLEQRPAARQLYSSLLAYMQGKEFNPAVQVDAAAVRALYR